MQSLSEHDYKHSLLSDSDTEVGDNDTEHYQPRPRGRQLYWLWMAPILTAIASCLITRAYYTHPSWPERMVAADTYCEYSSIPGQFVAADDPKLTSRSSIIQRVQATHRENCDGWRSLGQQKQHLRTRPFACCRQGMGNYHTRQVYINAGGGAPQNGFLRRSGSRMARPTRHILGRISCLSRHALSGRGAKKLIP